MEDTHVNRMFSSLPDRWSSGAIPTECISHTTGEQTIRTGPEVIKLFSCSTQQSTKFFLLKNVKMPTVVGILTFMSGKNSILGLSEPKKAEFLDIFILMSI